MSATNLMYTTSTSIISPSSNTMYLVSIFNVIRNTSNNTIDMIEHIKDFWIQAPKNPNMLSYHIMKRIDSDGINPDNIEYRIISTQIF